MSLFQEEERNGRSSSYFKRRMAFPELYACIYICLISKTWHMSKEVKGSVHGAR
jgi:hypothetical protein